MMHHTGIKNSEKREYTHFTPAINLFLFFLMVPLGPGNILDLHDDEAPGDPEWVESCEVSTMPEPAGVGCKQSWYWKLQVIHLSMPVCVGISLYFSLSLPFPSLSFSLNLSHSFSSFPRSLLLWHYQFLSFSICTHLSVSDCLLVFLSLSFPFLYAINIPKSLPLLCLFQTQQKALSIWTPQVNGLILLFINEVVPWFKWNSWFWL